MINLPSLRPTISGLIIDPYFSASKIAWLLDAVPDARARAKRGELAFGTVDSFILWRLTGGRVHATDATNASRTMLFDIHRQDWSDELLEIFGISRAILPEVRDSAADFGEAEAEHFGASVPVTGIAGDQHAAMIGQACFEPGMTKCTFGTGAFILVNTGGQPAASRNRLLTTMAYRLDGVPSYALEGSVFTAGAAVQWLRDGLGIIGNAAESEALARAASQDDELYLVPAFTGLGAPYWDAAARASIHGMTRDTGPAQLVRATLDSVCHQTRDLLEAMAADGARPATLRVDGGMAVNEWLMQRLADFLGLPVERPTVFETTALGAAYLAGLGVGLYRSPGEIANAWQEQTAFVPRLDEATRSRLYDGWRDAVRRTLRTES